MKLKGSVAVVTGVSHDNGIGAAVCRKFAEAVRIFSSHNGKRTEIGWKVFKRN